MTPAGYYYHSQRDNHERVFSPRESYLICDFIPPPSWMFNGRGKGDGWTQRVSCAHQNVFGEVRWTYQLQRGGRNRGWGPKGKKMIVTPRSRGVHLERSLSFIFSSRGTKCIETLSRGSVSAPIPGLFAPQSRVERQFSSL